MQYRTPIPTVLGAHEGTQTHTHTPKEGIPNYKAWQAILFVVVFGLGWVSSSLYAHTASPSQSGQSFVVKTSGLFANSSDQIMADPDKYVHFLQNLHGMPRAKATSHYLNLLANVVSGLAFTECDHIADVQCFGIYSREVVVHIIYSLLSSSGP